MSLQHTLYAWLDVYMSHLSFVPLDDYDRANVRCDALETLVGELGHQLDALASTEEWTRMALAHLDEYFVFCAALVKPGEVDARPVEVARRQARIAALKLKPQHAQRTRAWYEQNIDTLSASEITDVSATPGVRNALIRAKCAPRPPDPTPEQLVEEVRVAADEAALRGRMVAAWGSVLEAAQLRVDARGWGQRYEPVVKLIYKARTGESLLEFGRLLHDTVPRIGASPDGIEAGRGFLVEIKSVVSREIDGDVPYKYYGQMQTQMEVCDLPWVVFVETKFTEHTVAPVDKAPGADRFGAFLIVSEAGDDARCFYVYSPPFATGAEAQAWVDATRVPAGWVLQDGGQAGGLGGQHAPPLQATRFWYLETWAPQYVARNRRWWADMLPEIERFWRDVEHYRRVGCAGIAAVPRRGIGIIRWDEDIVERELDDDTLVTVDVGVIEFDA